MQHILNYKRPSPKEAKLHPFVKRNTVVFATFSNWQVFDIHRVVLLMLLKLNYCQKIDPDIFSTWMHVLKRVPNSILWFLKYSV